MHTCVDITLDGWYVRQGQTSIWHMCCLHYPQSCYSAATQDGDIVNGPGVRTN